jgi:hypothetical protein
MHSIILSLFISLWLGGCATSAQCTQSPTQTAHLGQRSCPGVYFFEFLVLSPSAQVESGGGAVVEMSGCGVAETKPSDLGQRFRVRISGERPEEAIVDAEVAGEKLHAKLPLVEDLRVVVEERWRADKGKVLVTMTAFESLEKMKEMMRQRLARSGFDPGAADSGRPPS